MLKTQEIKCTFNTHDWVFLCEVLAGIAKQPDFEQMSKHDYDRVISCLDSLEAGK